MRKNLNSKVEREIAEVLGHSAHKDMSVDEVLAMMLQVFLPVLMVFIISYFLFKTDVRQEIKRTQDVYKDPIVDNQRQTLMNALDKLEHTERKKLALVLFSSTNSDGAEVLDTTGLIEGGKLVDNELVKKTFINGCRYAKKNIPFPKKMAERWFNEVIKRAGVSLAKENYEFVNDPKCLVDENRKVLQLDIENRIKHITDDTRKLQDLAISELLKFYINNIDLLNDNEITELVHRVAKTKELKEKRYLMERVKILIKKHARNVFKEQGVELLNEI